MSSKKIRFTLVLFVVLFLFSSASFAFDCSITKEADNLALDWDSPSSSSYTLAGTSVTIPFKVLLEGKVKDRHNIFKDDDNEYYCPEPSAPFEVYIKYNQPQHDNFNMLYEKITNRFQIDQKNAHYWYSGENGFPTITITPDKLKSIGGKAPYDGEILIELHYFNAVKKKKIKLKDSTTKECVGRLDDYSIYYFDTTKSKIVLGYDDIGYTTYTLHKGSVICNGESYNKFVVDPAEGCFCVGEVLGSRKCASAPPKEHLSLADDNKITWVEEQYDIFYGSVECDGKKYNKYFIASGDICHCIPALDEASVICDEFKELEYKSGTYYNSGGYVIISEGEINHEGTEYDYYTSGSKNICLTKKGEDKKPIPKPKKVEVASDIAGGCRLDFGFEYAKADPQISESGLQDYLQKALATGASGIYMYTFASPEGSSKSNLELTQKRADAAEDLIAEVATGAGIISNPLISITNVGETQLTFSNNGFGSDRRAVLTTEPISYSAKDHSAFLPAPSLGSYTVDACQPLPEPELELEPEPSINETEIPEGVTCLGGNNAGCYKKEGSSWRPCLNVVCTETGEPLDPKNPADKAIIDELEEVSKLTESDDEKYMRALDLLESGRDNVLASKQITSVDDPNYGDRIGLRQSALEKIYKARTILFELKAKFKKK
ncbi:hypothetical protein HOK51_04020 [Candidatus Woesearchaeota archaeon]|jgi:hypothetical protein|nr:hypothetical protein [Candidatus Woesearchaeota archaeon]MBT6518988.1 hypothetical protein [Candidatus Woesearchaeota archaeon]MBT7368353.1 hypothetical protein [Candidatus Woesearchaeota archaeon]